MDCKWNIIGTLSMGILYIEGIYFERPCPWSPILLCKRAAADEEEVYKSGSVSFTGPFIL
jgi:hypothetical protein